MLSILSTLVPVFGIILFGIVVERMGFLPIETSAASTSSSTGSACP